MFEEHTTMNMIILLNASIILQQILSNCLDNLINLNQVYNNNY